MTPMNMAIDAGNTSQVDLSVRKRAVTDLQQARDLVTSNLHWGKTNSQGQSQIVRILDLSVDVLSREHHQYDGEMS